MRKPLDRTYKLIIQGVTFSTIVLALVASIITIYAWTSGNKNIDFILAIMSFLIAFASTLVGVFSIRQRK
jgi:hypothetical protein